MVQCEAQVRPHLNERALAAKIGMEIDPADIPAHQLPPRVRTRELFLRWHVTQPQRRRLLCHLLRRKAGGIHNAAAVAAEVVLGGAR